MGDDQISIRSKFLRIMLTGFRKRLKLPPAFCAKVKHEKSKRAILESRKGMWVINVCREDDDDQIFLENGWPRFADEHGLTLGDLLVFEHTEKLHFNVAVCDSSGCEKQFLAEPDIDNGHQSINSTYQAKKNAPLIRSQRPCFTHKLTHATATSRTALVFIPLEFARLNYLGRQKNAILKDPRRGRKWRVSVYVQKSPYFEMKLGSGWHHFVAANNLKPGDVCTFELNPMKSPTSQNISFDVHISRNTNRSLEFDKH